MLVAGLWSGHDTSCCVLDDGHPVQHIELERHSREKEAFGDSVALLKKHYSPWKKIQSFVGVHPKKKLLQYDCSDIPGIKFIGHHQAHAAHAFYSSNFEDAVVLTIDGGGVEDEAGTETATTLWCGEGTRLDRPIIIPSSRVNVGGLWTRITRYIFGLQSGYPRGHQAGTVMAMAALGDSGSYVRWLPDFRRMLRQDLIPASMKPAGQPNVRVPGGDPVHPYLDRWVQAATTDQIKFDMARAFQQATEEFIIELLDEMLPRMPKSQNICISGGVALNSVAMGKIKQWFPQFKGVYVPPVPYDGGLTLGAAQYVTHMEMGVPRVKWNKSVSPYLGATYSTDEIVEELINYKDRIDVKGNVTDDHVLDHVANGKIVSVFCGRAESGRRALGHRSIVADPRKIEIKDQVNEKVKHRQWFRPFAPSVLREEVPNWFLDDVDSPYMSFVSRFTEDAKKTVPAVVHFDGTARLQTVTPEDNGWWYDFIKAWHRKSGVPIILNTSFNDNEPIAESPKHAMECFLRTEIDYLYFPECGILLSKKEK